MRSGAGKADLALKILTLKGTTVPFNMNSSSDRDSVSYIPKEPGIHSIYVTCGGVDVPGRFLPNITENMKWFLVFSVMISQTCTEHLQVSSVKCLSWGTYPVAYCFSLPLTDMHTCICTYLLLHPLPFPPLFSSPIGSGP